MKQQYQNYTSEDLKVWSILFNRQINNLQNKACKEYLNALTLMQPVMNANQLPNFDEIAEWFQNSTGWTIECVPGLIPMEDFFALLAEKKFPSSTWLRSLDKLDYLEEPDMFHDIFGHIPLLAQPDYADFVNRFGLLGKSIMNDKEKLLMLKSLYWFTIEFGLIQEKDDLRIYGAGILSSYGESITSLQSDSVKKGFKTNEVITTTFCTSSMQQEYFIINSMEQLNQSIEEVILYWEKDKMMVLK